jgi:hypothetical protein
MTIEEGREMIEAGMVLGIGAAVGANPCMTGAATVLLEAFDGRRRPVRTPRNIGRRLETAESSAGVLRIARAPALA